MDNEKWIMDNKLTVFSYFIFPISSFYYVVFFVMLNAVIEYWFFQYFQNDKKNGIKNKKDFSLIFVNQ